MENISTTSTLLMASSCVQKHDNIYNDTRAIRRSSIKGLTMNISNTKVTIEDERPIYVSNKLIENVEGYCMYTRVSIV